MKLIKQNPSTLMPTFNGFFDDFFRRDLADWGFQNFSPTRTTLPSVNIVESKDDFLVEMAAPGMSKKDFRIELDNETLTISSEKETKDEVEDNDHYSRREFSYQAFHRTFHLPQTVVDEKKIKASYENGILRVVIPKKEEAKAHPPRMIAIQ